jgi:adenylate cyclase
MDIQQQNGIISTITFTPYIEIEAYQNLRNYLFREAELLSNFSTIRRIDAFDESILVFETISQSLSYLLNVFRAATKLGETSGINFSLRSSLCEGDYFLQQDQIYGDAVNLATRLSCTSRENELLVCGIDRQLIEEFIQSQHDVRHFIRSHDENCISISLLDEELTSSENDNKELQIELSNKTSVFEACRNQKILIGRSRDADIIIDSDEISRNHATISLNYDNIFIEDHSSNGTYLYFGGREIFLTNDSMKVSGKGCISCGRKKSIKEAPASIISYLLRGKSKAVA